MLNEKEREICLKIVQESISKRLGLVDKISDCPDEYPVFKEKFGLFVTLKINQQLKGCIGYIFPYKDLYHSLIDLSCSAAFGDRRFRPVSDEEYPLLEYEISVLSPLYELSDFQEIEIGRDGLYIESPRGAGLLLPQVAIENNWDVDTFLEYTCYKAGLNKNALKEDKTKVFKFSAEIF